MTTTSFTSRREPGRRTLLGATLAAGAAVPLGLASRASAATGSAAATATGRGTTAGAPTSPTAKAATGAPAQLLIPPPTGPHRVGTVDLHLVDASRPDPLNPGRPYPLMASIWYPARDADRFPVAPWMPAGVFQAWLAGVGFPPTSLPVPATVGHIGAPVRRGGRPRPVIVFSHGAHDHRSDTTTVVQQLVSHGYIVATVDHTYDAYTQFPGGPVLSPDFTDRVPMSPSDFAADARFLLDAIEEIAAGRNPDVDRHPLPDGLPGALDLDRIGMFGWSKGGTATALATLADDRIRAGLSFDGPMQPTITTDLAKPFMMMSAVFTRSTDPDAQEFWTHLKGWRRYLQLNGAQHISFSDSEGLIGPAAQLLGLDQAGVQSFIGTMDAGEGVRIQQAYPLAFFDLHLRHRPSPLLDGPSPSFPDVQFIA
ncbi:acetylhydrolase [Catenulispora sp. NL8]|uniref:Acetylhydrolase n=1 Tax=Catenulispora pinistramenti TaxID=2705254 RepID=A0ABS5KXQ7_9ACTN|nr:acetylhydrolase [Catenulispora pinistramenti]MBS2550824.1 acetylhydrolase [Catenulispora pinistramenti]